ncbi:hypothetical protein [Methylobacterium sp. WL116]|uniref:hypothetical protein n=1 Tax=Methylobacterium sp. WL116 TaxID=2603889 RepID=UPI0011C7FDA6|nr:hypothetical protein [Methylobacterium sp. WL116]TXM92635.1 hypothetical protein FV223_11150 [Methylobacterium sp. WL116]
MRIATVAIILFTVPAAAGGYTKATPAEYQVAYGKARAYALAHQTIEWPPSCRAVIGAKAVKPLMEACGLVAGGTTHMRCRPAMPCHDILDRLAQYCIEWKGNVPCVAIEDGGEDRQDPRLRGRWQSP